MKKSLIVLGTLVSVAFAMVWLLKKRAAGGTTPESSPNAAEMERVKDFWAAYNQGNQLRAQGEFAQAVPAFRKALALNPHHEDSLYYLGTSLFETGEYRQAADEFRQILALDPESGRGWSQLGNTLSTQAPGAPVDFAEARKAYQHSAELNREQAGPFLRLGNLDLHQGRYGPALENFKIAAGFGSPEGNYQWAYALFLEGRYRESLARLRSVLDTYAKDRRTSSRGVLSEGDVLAVSGKPLTSLEKAGLASMLLLRWVSRNLAGHPQKALQPFQRAGSAEANEGVFRPLAGFPSRLASGRAAAADFDHSGYPGLVVTGGASGVRLYRNLGGRFEDVTKTAGLSRAQQAWDAYWVDYDGDGYPDLYLVQPGFIGSGQNTLYHNNRNGTFTDVTAPMGLSGRRSTARACFADFGGDGRVDLLEVGGSDAAQSSVRLFRNTGKRFVEVTSQAGLARSGTAVDCAVSDFNRDGRPDLFVLFWRKEVALFANRGNERFSEVTAQAGLKGIRGEGLSAIFFDYDNDRYPDLLITDYAPFDQVVPCLLQPGYRTRQHTPRLFRNRGNGSFEEVTAHLGFDRSYGTIQVVAADLDMDGWMDLVLVNGSLDAERLEPSVVLHNLQGRRFEEWFYLPGLDTPGNFVGAAVADFNHDGKPDLFLGGNPGFRTTRDPSGVFINALPRRGQAAQVLSSHPMTGGSSAAEGSRAVM